MKIRLSFTGGTDLAKRLGALSQAASKSVLREALKKAGEPIRARAASLAPRAPGAPDLADHMVMSSTSSVRGERIGPQGAAIAIGPSRDFIYGKFIELGTVKLRARPYLRPAFDTGTMQALATLRAELWDELRRRAGGSFTASNAGTRGGGLL